MLIVADRAVVAGLKGVGIQLMTEQTVDETVSSVVSPGPGVRDHTITLKVSANVTGAVQIETAQDPLETGIWSPLGGSPIDLSTIGAAGVLELMFSNLIITALRARITTVVAGGNLTVIYTGR